MCHAANNNLVGMTDAKGKTDTCTFDARDRKISCTDRNGGITAHGYDVNSNLIEIIDADSSLGVTTYDYDPRNLKVKTTYPTHNPASSPGQTGYEIVEYAYDALGRSRVNTDQNGDTTSFVHDLAGRMTERRYRLLGAGSDESVDAFTYDLASRLLSAEKGRSHVVTSP